MSKPVYVCYKGEEVDFIGSEREVMEHYGWTRKHTLTFYCTPTARKRDNGRNLIIERVSDIDSED